MKKIGITGSTGFIGQAVQKRLEKESDFVVENFDKQKHSLFDPESLESFVEGKDVIIHLAGVNRGTNQELFQTNVLGTLSLLDAVVKYAPSARIILAFKVLFPPIKPFFCFLIHLIDYTIFIK